MKNLLAAIVAVFLANTLSFAQMSLTSIVPLRNAIGVSLDETPLLHFSANVDAESALSAFVIESNLRGKLSFSVTVQANSVKITPAVPFISSEQITISILTSLKSTSGIPLDLPVLSMFETAATAARVSPPNFVSHTIASMSTEQIRRISPADLDGDSDIDICFFSGTIGWLENDGRGVFTIHNIATVNDFPNDIKTADIDHDGDIDIITAASYNGIIIYENNGDGEFAASINLRVITPSRIDIADLNGDGFSDIVFSALELQSEQYVGGTYIYYQDEGGAFTKKKIDSEYSHLAECVDIDKDGDWDIIQHNDNNVYYLENRGTDFISVAILQTEVAIYELAVANLNSDENADLILFTAGQNQFKINALVSDGEKNFTVKNIVSEFGLTFLTAGDFDGDGDIDINFIAGDYDYQVAENDGNGNFNNKLLGIKGEARYSPANTVNADFNGDGDLDFAAVPSANHIDLFDNTIYPFSVNPFPGITPLSEGDADWGDFDSDGDLDLMSTGFNTSAGKREATLYQNNSGALEAVPTEIEPTWLGSCDWNDFDNDGDLDLLMMGNTVMSASDAKPQTLIYKNDDNHFTAMTSSVTQLPSAWFGEARWADMNNDGLSDIVFSANGFSGIYQSTGNGDFVKACELPLVFTHGNIAVGDYDEDGDLDLAMSGWSGSFEIGAILKVYRNDGNGNMSEVTGEFMGIYGGNLDWADMNGDGDLDLVATGQNVFPTGGGIPTMTVYENENYAFKAIQNSEALYFTDADGTSAAGDYDNDGSIDIIASRAGSSNDPQLTLLINNGQGNLGKSDIKLPKTGTRVLSWGDFDLDHDLDVFTGAELLVNNIDEQNSPPTKPTGITVDSVSNNSIFLKWNAGTDIETPQASLSYQLYMGTQSQTHDIVSPNSNLVTGVRKIAESGSSTGNNGMVAHLKGGTYFFGVQSIDGSFMPSAFSEEGHVFVIGIHGPSSSCLTLESSYVAFPAGNYSWQVAGGTIVSGQGSDKVTVKWNKTGKGYVKVANATGSRNTLVIDIDEIPIPVIVGDPTVCTGSQSYAIADNRSHSVEWKVSGIVEPNESSTTIIVDLQKSGDYDLTARAYPTHKGCFTDAVFQLFVDQRPDATIGGNSVVCEGALTSFSTPATNTEWTIVNGTLLKDNGSSVDTKWSVAGAGKVVLKASSDRGFCVERSELAVKVNARPPKPSIEIFQDTILYTPSVSPAGYYYWYYYDELAITGPYDGVIPYVSGEFTVEVFSIEGCSHKSDRFFYNRPGNVTAVEKSTRDFNVYPNPADDKIVLNLPEGAGGFELEFYSAVNSSSANFKYVSTDPSPGPQIDVSHLAPGVYILIARTISGTFQTRFVKK